MFMACDLTGNRLEWLDDLNILSAPEYSASVWLLMVFTMLIHERVTRWTTIVISETKIHSTSVLALGGFCAAACCVLDHPGPLCIQCLFHCKSR